MKKLIIIILLLSSCTECKQYEYTTDVILNKWQDVSGTKYMTSTSYYISTKNGEIINMSMKKWATYSIGDTIYFKQCKDEKSINYNIITFE